MSPKIIAQQGESHVWLGFNKGIQCNYYQFFSKLANHHIRHQATQSGLSAWWLHIVTLIFFRGLCGYVWVNILTLSPPRGLRIRVCLLMLCNILFTAQKCNLSYCITMCSSQYRRLLARCSLFDFSQYRIKLVKVGNNFGVGQLC